MKFNRVLSFVFVLILICSSLPAVYAQEAEEVLLTGTFNNWQGTVMSADDKGSYSLETYLEAGNYQFKLKVGDTALGYPGTIKDTTERVSSKGVELSSETNANATFIATGGNYSFSFNKETNRLRVIRNNEVSEEVQSDTLKVNFADKEVYARVGDKLSYSVYLTADKAFEDIQSVLSFDDEKLSLVDVNNPCPNLIEAVVGVEHTGIAAVNATDFSGFDFTEEKLLLTFDFLVLKGGETSLEFTVQEMTATDGTSYFTYSNKSAEGADLREDITLTTPQSEVKGYNISLKDNIAVSFHIKLSDAALADENARVVFTLPNGNTKTVYVKNAEEKDGRHVFTCEVAAKEMTAEIKGKIVAKGDTSEVFYYSVKEYADTLLSDTVKYEKEIPLVKAMLNYGASAQLYFNYKTDDLANKDLDKADQVLADVDLSNYGYTLQGEETGVSYYGSKLSLKSETAIKHYFIVEDKENIPEFKVNGKVVKAVDKGEYFEVKVEGILAQNLDSDCIVEVGNLTLNYSALSYGDLALKGSNTNLQNVVKALYAYNQAAKEY